MANAPPAFSKKEIYDLVDYYQLGSNAYQQYLTKHLSEEEVIKTQNLETRLKNIDTALAVSETQIRKSMEEKQLNMMEFTKKFIMEIQEKNGKNLNDLIENITDINKDIANIVLDQFGVLSDVTIKGYKKISYTLRSNLADLQQNISLLFLNSAQNSIEQTATITAKINELAKSNKESLNELSLHETKAFGSLTVKLESIMGQSTTLAKVMETTNVMIEGQTSLLRAEIAKIAGEIAQWKLDLSALEEKLNSALTEINRRETARNAAAAAVTAEEKAADAARDAAIIAIQQDVIKLSSEIEKVKTHIIKIEYREELLGNVLKGTALVIIPTLPVEKQEYLQKVFSNSEEKRLAQAQ